MKTIPTGWCNHKKSDSQNESNPNWSEPKWLHHTVSKRGIKKILVS